MKRRCKSPFFAIQSMASIPFEGVFDLQRGEVEKVFINTKDAHYIVSNRQVTCTIETFLKVRYKSGKFLIISTYTATGVSKCAPEDRFNLLTGIKLATARAENNYNTYYLKILHKYYSSSVSLAEKLSTLLDDCSIQLAHNNCQFIPSLIDKK